jgi:hypothetical protein
MRWADIGMWYFALVLIAFVLFIGATWSCWTSGC